MTRLLNCFFSFLWFASPSLCCPTGWTELGGSCYMVAPRTSTWYAAQSFCWEEEEATLQKSPACLSFPCWSYISYTMRQTTGLDSLIRVKRELGYGQTLMLGPLGLTGGLDYQTVTMAMMKTV